MCESSRTQTFDRTSNWTTLFKSVFWAKGDGSKRGTFSMEAEEWGQECEGRGIETGKVGFGLDVGLRRQGTGEKRTGGVGSTGEVRASAWGAWHWNRGGGWVWTWVWEDRNGEKWKRWCVMCNHRKSESSSMWSTTYFCFGRGRAGVSTRWVW